MGACMHISGTCSNCVNLKWEYQPKRLPHICPLCEGKGIKNLTKKKKKEIEQLGSLSSVPSCNGCYGTGIVWG